MVTLTAHDQYPQSTPQHDIDLTLSRKRTELGGLDYKIDIKEGARVMLTTHLDVDDHLINGPMGTIKMVHFNETFQKPDVVYINFDDISAGKNRIAKSADQFAKQNNAVPIVPVLTKIKIKENRMTSPEIERTQFPITLAWACTANKVQGLTLDKAVFNFELFKQKSFNYGQVYVAFSRVKALDQLFIVGKFDPNSTKADLRVHKEYERLRSPLLKPLITDINVMNSDNIVITLLNVCSLKKHSIDLRYDNHVMNSNILALTEINIAPNELVNQIEDDLVGFTLTKKDSHNAHLSLALCSDENISQSEKVTFPEVNGLLVKLNKTTISFNLLLIYRPHASNKDEYVQSLGTISSSHFADIILGDFNINYLNETDSLHLKQLMTSYDYIQLVDSPTYVSSGSLLDHVFIKIDLTHKYTIEHLVKAVCYSDHDAVKIAFSLN